jgi:hypothetical protein
MLSHLFYYQLVLIALVWLCIITPWAMAKRPRCHMLNDTGAPTPTAQA